MNPRKVTPLFTGRRIIVVGSTGSGKTTLASKLSTMLGMPHIEMDALFWEENWTGVAPEVFRARVEQVTCQPTWVIDGNYSRVRDIVWGRADTVIWLDYPAPVIFWRLLWRTLRRTIMQEELWSGNRERLANQFLSRDSLFLWAARKIPQHRRDYPALLASPEFHFDSVLRLRSPAACRRWLKSLTPR